MIELLYDVYEQINTPELLLFWFIGFVHLAAKNYSLVSFNTQLYQSHIFAATWHL